MKRYSIILFIALLPFYGYAQNYKADIQEALKVYALPKLQLDAKIDVFPNYSATQASQTYKAVIKKDGDNYFSEMNDVRMLLNEKFLVMIYKTEKRIVCTSRDKNSEKKIKGNNDPRASIDSLLAKNDSIVYKGIKDGAKTYVIYTGKSMIRRTEIYLDMQTGYIKRLVYYYNEQLVPMANKVRIDYTINTSPSFSATEFSEKRFIVFSRNKASASGECTGYHVIYVDPETNNPVEN